MNTQRKPKTDDIQKVTFEQCLTLLTLSWNTRTPMLIVGPPATAKTAIAKAFAEYNDFDLIVSTGSTDLPTDAKGMPTTWKNDDGTMRADFIPFGDLQQAIEAKKPTLWVFDDFTNSDKDVQKSRMQLLHERQVYNHKISDYVHIIATGNRREDKSGVSGLIEAVKTRFGMVVEVVPDVDGYMKWAIPAGIHPDVLGYLRFQPENLYVHNPTNDMNREANLRMWKYLSDTLHELEDMDADDNIAAVAIKATCGAALGKNVIDYRALKAELPDVDACLASPDDCDLPNPDQIGVMFAFNALLARRATVTNIQRIIKIADRLPREFGAKLIFDAIANAPDAADTSAYLAWSGRNRSAILDI